MHAFVCLASPVKRYSNFAGFNGCVVHADPRLGGLLDALDHVGVLLDLGLNRVHGRFVGILALDEVAEAGRQHLPVDHRPDENQPVERHLSGSHLVGTGDRSDRIRTYNFPQGRLTDHRINFTLYKLETIMDGKLEEVIVPLTVFDQEEKLKLIQ